MAGIAVVDVNEYIQEADRIESELHALSSAREQDEERNGYAVDYTKYDEQATDIYASAADTLFALVRALKQKAN
jgi:hypothetical protein